MRKAKRVLLVEDDHATAEMLTVALKEAPEENGAFSVKWVETAGEAIRILLRCSSDRRQKGCPDLVLLDLMLPDTFSKEMLLQLSLIPNLPPIIVVSAKPSPYIEEAAKTIDAAAVLQKPFPLDALWEQISLAL